MNTNKLAMMAALGAALAGPAADLGYMPSGYAKHTCKYSEARRQRAIAKRKKRKSK